MRKFFLTLMLVFCAAGVLYADELKESTGSTLEAMKKADFTKAPDFNLRGLDNNRVVLDSYKGKIVIVNFWATWCHPCKNEIPYFIELYEKYKDKGVVIIGISVDNPLDFDKVKTFAAENKINYPIAIGHRVVIQAYQLGQAIPVSFVLDRKLELFKQYNGVPVSSDGKTDLDAFNRDIEELLKADKENPAQVPDAKTSSSAGTSVPAKN